MIKVNPRYSRPTIITVAAASSALVFWIWFASKKQEVNRRITSVAVSSSGRWTAAATAQGSIAIWDRQNAKARQEIRIEQGTLNDLQFSPDERFLAVANRRLELCPTEQIAAFRFVRADDRNYGTVRFGTDSEDLLTITGTGTIETLAGIPGNSGSESAARRFMAR